MAARRFRAIVHDVAAPADGWYRESRVELLASSFKKYNAPKISPKLVHTLYTSPYSSCTPRELWAIDPPPQLPWLDVRYVDSSSARIYHPPPAKTRIVKSDRVRLMITAGTSRRPIYK